MAERSNRAVLTALRAAAIVIIATGLNEVIAGALPPYEPLYVYLGAIALVVVLDGVLLGVATAVVSLAFYALLFLPRTALPAALLVPLGWMAGTVAVAAVVRGLIRSRVRRTAVPEIFPRDMLPAMAEQASVLSAIDDLRGELREREAALERSYSAARENLTLRVHAAEEERSRLSQLLDAERAERQRLDAAARQAEADARARADAARSETVEARALADAARSEAAMARAELDAFRQEVDAARRDRDAARQDAETARTEAAAARQAETEARALAEKVRQSEAAARAMAEMARQSESEARALAEMSGRSETDARQSEEIARRSEAGMRALAETARRETAAARTEADAANAEAERFRADAQQARAALETARAEAAAKTEDIAALRAAADELRKALEIERARNEGEKTLRTTAVERLTEMEREAARARERMAALEQTAAEERALRERLELDAGTYDSAAATLRTRVRELEQSLESARLRAADEERRLQESIATLEKTNAEGVAASETLRAAAETLQADVETLQAEAERLQGEVESRRAAAETLQSEAETLWGETETLRARIAELERSLDSTRLGAEEAQSLRERVEREAQAAADTLRTEVETLKAASETLRAEAETMRARIAELERSLDSTRLGAEEAQAAREKVEREAQATADDAALLRIRIGELEQALADVAAANDEAAVRASADFDAKLQTIVAHLASDHEADLGKAVEEREEARAEARSMTLRLKRVEDERHAMLMKVRELEERYRQSIEDSTRLLEQTRSAAQGEIDRLHGRVVELEHGIARGLRAAPPPVARPRVLVAHPDGDLRMNARASLERAGYEVLTAGDGLEALRTAIAQRPDVVITDAVMPKMDGRELCQLLKSQEKTAHIRVVMLLRPTDDPPRGDLVPDEVLRKPVPLETMKATLAGLLANK